MRIFSRQAKHHELHDELLKFRHLWTDKEHAPLKASTCVAWGSPRRYASPLMVSGITVSSLTEKMAAKVSMPPVLKVMYGIFSEGIPAFPKMLLV